MHNSDDHFFAETNKKKAQTATILNSDNICSWNPDIFSLLWDDTHAGQCRLYFYHENFYFLDIYIHTNVHFLRDMPGCDK